MIRGSIWTLPFGKIRFSQFNTASADIFTHCCFFSARTEELPEVIALDYVLIALNFPAKLCVFAFQIRCTELAANGFVLGKLLLQTGDLCLELCNQPVCSVQSLLQLGFLFLGRNITSLQAWTGVQNPHAPRQPCLRRGQTSPQSFRLLPH